MARVGDARNRLWLSVGLLIAVVLGLASRKYPAFCPAFLGKYPGDALWAIVVFLAWALLRPTLTSIWLALLALATSYAVEVSQLYRVPWLDAVRGTTLGHLVLGSAFSWLDIAAYAVGISIAVCVDLLFRRLANGDRKNSPPPRDAAKFNPTAESRP